MIKRLFLGVCLTAAAASALARGLEPRDLAALARLSDPRVSPDGSTVAFVLRETDLEANRGRTDVWLLDLDTENAVPRRLTDHEENDGTPQWSADGRAIWFISGRSGSSQVWRIDARGGEASQVTDYPVDVANLLLSPDGRRIAFTAEVFPDCDTLACTRQRLDAREESDRTGMLYDELFVRHWDTWEDGRRSVLFVAEIDAEGRARQPEALSDTLDGDVPSVPFGGREEMTFSADGEALYFTLREAGPTEPWSTNFDIFRVSADGSRAPENLTDDNDAWDTHPVVSPGGRALAWAAMRRPGYESDQLDLMIRNLETGDTRNVTADWDRTVRDFAFAPDGEKVYVTAGDVGTRAIFAIDVGDGSVRRITEGKAASGLQVTEDKIIYVLESLASPADLYALPLDGRDDAVRLTSVNAQRLNDIEMGSYEQFSFEGAQGDTVYGYVVRPVGFDEDETWPIAFLIHGGPQGTFSEGWSYRWNPQTYAAGGYGVVMVDFHGSITYGQRFTDAINRDWGGKPLVDLRKGLEAAVQRYPWLEAGNACALGASYGGYMINWIAGNWPDRFRCLVNHDGIFDLRSFYYSTEELWFPEWDFGGPYYRKPEAYERWNPVNHVRDWRTPMLVIHGVNDFRVPLEQGLGAFTALQRQGVPSRLLVFPDENHWVLSPANSIQWHETVAAWLARWLK